MSFLILFIVVTTTLIISKHLFKKWFNHLTIYVITWGGMIFLYELKYLSYYDIGDTTWFIICGGFLSFFLGSITIFFAKNTAGHHLQNTHNNNEILFYDNGKILKYTALFFSTIGLFGAIQTWMVLFRMFGSLPKILLSGNTIYQLRVSGEVEGVIPYLISFSLLGIFFSGIYTAYRGKLTIISIIPIVAIILKSIADFSRIQMLLGMMEFLVTVILFRNFMAQHTVVQKKFSNKKLYFEFIGIILLVIFGATLVKTFRGTIESYKGASSALNETKSNLFISPSLYLYLSSNIGVLNKFIEENNEEANFGENTFTPIYNFLSKFNLTERVSFNERGYFIPMWSNSATYLRELYADYGIAGIFLIPYLLGLLTTYTWMRFFTTSELKYFPLLVFLLVLISLSWFSSMTKGGNWLISLTILGLMTPIIDTIILGKKKINTT